MREGILVNPEISQHLIQRWNHLIKIHPDGSFWQSWYAFQLFSRTKFFEPVVLFYFQQSDLVAVLLGVNIKETGTIKSLFSSRLVVYGGPLILPDLEQKDHIAENLLAELVSVCRKKSIFIQVRAFYDLGNYSVQFKNHRFRWVPRINLLIDTMDKEHVLKGISAARKRQVRKSLENGAKVVEPEDLEDVKKFYLILKNLYRTKVRKPLPDWSFFHSFYELINEHNCGKYFLVKYENQVIGGIMIPYFPEKQVYEWYVCGLDRDFNSKGIYPSVLATWSAIFHATENNFKVFDFMGVGKPDVPYGVRDFKLTFGGKIVNYGRYIRINQPFLYTFAEIGYNLLTFFKKV